MSSVTFRQPDQWMNDSPFIPAEALSEALTSVEMQELEGALSTEEGQEKAIDLIADFINELPTLIPPRFIEDLTLAMIRSQQEEVGLINEQIKDHCDQIDAHKNEKMKLTAAHIKKIQENLEKANQSNAWGMLGKVSTWLASLVTIAIGATAISTGAGVGPGVAMILSGVALLSTQLASEFGLFEKIAEKIAGKDLEKKAAILQQLQIWSMVATICLSMGSMAAGYTVFLTDKVANSAFTAIQALMQISSGVSVIGKTIADKGRLETERDSKYFESMISMQAKQLKELINSNKIKTDRWKSWSKLSTQIINTDAEKNRSIRRLAAPAA